MGPAISVSSCMSVMAPDPKVCKAFDAMRALGIPFEKVKPVLKNLLRLYDKNWTLIEEENYRALADAIFEYEENKAVKDCKKDAMADDGTEPSTKRLRLAKEEADLLCVANKKRSKLPEGDGQTPSPSYGEDITVCPTSRIEARNQIRFSLPCSRGDRQSTPEEVRLKQPMRGLVHTQTGNMSGTHHGRHSIIPKPEQIINDDEHFVAPAPTSLVNSDTGIENDVPQSNCRKSCGSGLDIASSLSGEVKISLEFSSAVGRHDPHIPSFDRVIKFVEDRYLKSHKIIGPPFSLKKLMEDLCETYLGLRGDLDDTSASSNCSTSTSIIGSKPNREDLKFGHLQKHLSKKDSNNCTGSSRPQGMLTSQLLLNPVQRKRPTGYITDITKGTEKVNISLMNETGNEDFPLFVYIPQNMVYQSAYVHVSVARIADDDCCPSCSGDCLLSSIPCACARETGGEFAYTVQGRLTEEFLEACISMNQAPKKRHFFFCKECPLERGKNENMPEPCKGHLVKKFIKECWRRCGCNMQCGNRIVQRGIACKLQVSFTREGKGWGLQTLEDLPRGAFVCEYVGEILTNTELYERNNRSTGNARHTYPVLLDADWGSEGVLKDEEALCLDATYFGNVARFINHRCFDANLIEVPVEVETPDHHYYHLAFFTQREVKALEELTWDYGIDFSDVNHPIKAFRCCCGSAFCRDKNQNGTRSSSSMASRSSLFRK